MNWKRQEKQRLRIADWQGKQAGAKRKEETKHEKQVAWPKLRTHTMCLADSSGLIYKPDIFICFHDNEDIQFVG